jgi:hypothetical protein
MLVFRCKTCERSFTASANNTECDTCISLAIKSALLDREVKLKTALQLLRELDDPDANVYLDISYRVRIKEILKDHP